MNMPKITIPNPNQDWFIADLERWLNAEPFEEMMLQTKDASYIIFEPTAVLTLDISQAISFSTNDRFTRSAPDQTIYRFTEIDHRMLVLDSLRFFWMAAESDDERQQAESNYRAKLEAWEITEEQFDDWWEKFNQSHPRKVDIEFGRASRVSGAAIPF